MAWKDRPRLTPLAFFLAFGIMAAWGFLGHSVGILDVHPMVTFLFHGVAGALVGSLVVWDLRRTGARQLTRQERVMAAVALVALACLGLFMALAPGWLVVAVVALTAALVPTVALVQRRRRQGRTATH